MSFNDSPQSNRSPKSADLTFVKGVSSPSSSWRACGDARERQRAHVARSDEPSHERDGGGHALERHGGRLEVHPVESDALRKQTRGDHRRHAPPTRTTEQGAPGEHRREQVQRGSHAVEQGRHRWSFSSCARIFSASPPVS